MNRSAIALRDREEQGVTPPIGGVGDGLFDELGAKAPTLVVLVDEDDELGVVGAGRGDADMADRSAIVEGDEVPAVSGEPLQPGLEGVPASGWQAHGPGLAGELLVHRDQRGDVAGLERPDQQRLAGIVEEPRTARRAVLGPHTARVVPAIAGPARRTGHARSSGTTPASLRTDAGFQ